MPDKIQGLLAQQGEGGRARPRQQISSHGYTREKLESDPAVAAYLLRYQVMMEPVRKTGVATGAMSTSIE